MNFLGVGVGELLLILVIAMLVVGPERMVEVAGQMGRMLAKFREQSDSITREFKEAFTLELGEDEEAEADAASGASDEATGGAKVPALSAGGGDAAAEPRVLSPEEASALEVARLEERMATGLVDGELEVVQAPVGVEGDGTAANGDEDDSYREIEPVDLKLAAIVPEDEDVEPTTVSDVLVIPDEDAPAELPLEAEE